jgi:hypothetical protein
MKYASRKFIVAVLALLLVTWMRFRGVLADESTATVMVTAILGYVGSNVAQKATAKPEVLS